MFVPQSAVLNNPISPTHFSNFRDVSRFRVLVVDDQQDILLALCLLLTQNGYQVETAKSPRRLDLLVRTFRTTNPELRMGNPLAPISPIAPRTRPCLTSSMFATL